MMKKVTFGMYYEVYGTVTIDVPDDINEDNVEEYLRENWDDLPLPTGAEYVQCSDELDTENIQFEED
jgi:hypothetical protein